MQFNYIPAAGTDWRIHVGVPREFASQGKYKVFLFRSPKGEVVFWKALFLTLALAGFWPEKSIQFQDCCLGRIDSTNVN